MPSAGSKFTQSAFIRNAVFGRKQIVNVNCTRTRKKVLFVNFPLYFVFVLFLWWRGGSVAENVSSFEKPQIALNIRLLTA